MNRPTQPFPSISRRALIGAGLALPLVSPRLGAGASRAETDTPGAVIVDTQLGRIQGLQHETHAVFQGVPFARPPVDDLRWMAPQPLEPWGDAIVVADKPGPIAPQAQMPFLDDRESGEDCLYLNVWVPGVPEPGASKPVIVFIHGGANLFGAGSDYLASRLTADEDVIVVTFNYRMGIFGTFGFPGLPDSGTFGLLDQCMALVWVRDHIAAFGGDPGNVTLMGQSWGGLGVSAHLVSPMSEGLFHRAIVQSGVMLADFPAGTMIPDIPAIPTLWLTAEEHQEAAASMLDELRIVDGEDVVGILRKVPASVLAPFSGLFIPYEWGNRFMPENPQDLTRTGAIHPVPVISGSNRDEARFFTMVLNGGLSNGADEGSYTRMLETAFESDAVAIEAAYPLAEFPSPEVAWSKVVTDRVWARQTLEQHRAYAAVQPTWAYEFRDREAPTGLLAVGGEHGAGAYHGAELAYQFDVGEPAPLAASQRRLAAMMNRYWANFARTGNPNGEGLPVWAQYRGEDVVLGLDDEDDGVAPVDFVGDHRLDFWADHGAIPIEE
jgi:para-nitrobenzyl esterase